MVAIFPKFNSNSLIIFNVLLGAKGNVKSVNSNKSVFPKHAVDHRPTRLLVSGYEGDEQDSILAHFGVFLLLFFM